ncbi:MAG: septal ring lytic transglycosylase RlpA family protein [Deltaproteobacteria bacterium]|nr:septal ring lytic transglycosylase RlpA family protein [Deltaproteobacteria bacterium]
MALPVGVSLLFFAVPPQGRCAEKTGAQIKVAAEVQPGTAARTHGVAGFATYYAKRYTGRKTASGKPYRPGKLTGAHPSLPLGTKVRVTDLKNGRAVVVTINDRCRKRKFNIIDLSRAAAKQLGFVRKGKVAVRIERLDGAQEPQAPETVASASSHP